MPTATKVKRPTRRQFIARTHANTRELVKGLLEGYDVTVSPSGSYARITRDGETLGYVLPGKRHVRVLVPPRVTGAPKTIARTLTPAGHGMSKIIVADDADESQARELLSWLASVD